MMYTDVMQVGLLLQLLAWQQVLSARTRQSLQALRWAVKCVSAGWQPMHLHVAREVHVTSRPQAYTMAKATRQGLTFLEEPR